MNDKPLFTADREHIHHKLLAMGLSQRQVAAMLYGVSALFAAISLLLFNGGGNKSVGLALVVVGTIVWIALQRVKYLEVSELQREPPVALEQGLAAKEPRWNPIVLFRMLMEHGIWFRACRTLLVQRVIIAKTSAECDLNN